MALNYKKLHLKIHANKTQNSVTSELLTEILKKCYDSCSFSTLPYKMYGFDSIESIFKTGTGNCIAMSYFLQHWLLKNHNIQSYLIPCTIPKKYQKPEYLTLSHVALAIPRSKHHVFIVDMAFYFNSPISMLLNSEHNKSIVHASNIYTNKVDTLFATTQQTQEHTVLNPYQQMPSNVYYSECFCDGDVEDKWNYYLINITNPDAAISNFYLQVSNPFITTTTYQSDKNSCRMNVYIKFTNNNEKLLVKINGELFFDDDPKLFTHSQMDVLRRAMGKFYDPNLPEYVFGKPMFNYFDF